MVTIDKEFEIKIYSPVCLLCRHFGEDINNRSCKAFPKKNSIPLEIWNGDNKHTKPFPGDNGITFTPR